jgi:hypothetical protein
MDKLHPLHTVTRLAQEMASTGCYPDHNQRTGRTTVLALKAITSALANPGMAVQLHDHVPTRESNKLLAELVRDFVGRLGLQHVHVEQVHQWIVTFERRSECSQ